LLFRSVSCHLPFTQATSQWNRLTLRLTALIVFREDRPTDTTRLSGSL
jgi:hypothetical protein